MVSSTASLVHGSRIRQYVDSLESSVATMQSTVEQTDRMWFAVESSMNTRLINEILEILHSWKVLRDSGDIWEPFEMIYEDMPSVACLLLLSKKNTGIIRKARAVIDM